MRYDGGKSNQMTKDEEEFLRENNGIEGVFDEESFKQAKVAWKYLMKQDVLTIDVILKTHKLLMLHQPLQPNEKGYFRRVPVWVGGREGASWRTIPSLLWHWTFESLRAEPKLTAEDIQKLHVEYEKIHPFVDGNGRTGRMFMNWQRLKKAGEPLLIIHTGEEQQSYYRWFY